LRSRKIHKKARKPPPHARARVPPAATWHIARAQDAARRFQASHGLGVRAVALRVTDAAAAHAAAVAHGARAVLPPTHLGGDDASRVTLAEVALYGDVVLRFITRSSAPSGAQNTPSDPLPPPFLPGYAPVPPTAPPRCYGLRRIDHVVGNVPILADALAYVSRFTGFHEFAEFVSDDVGTSNSGLNSVVLASNDERVLLPLNEPTHGTARKSQIQTFLEQNEGPGVQHLALKTDDIFATLALMHNATELGGFEFLRAAGPEYYSALPSRIGRHALTNEQISECERMGVLVDRDDQGLLLQIFTKPLGDRPTVFIEVIQRVGCRLDADVAGVNDARADADGDARVDGDVRAAPAEASDGGAAAAGAAGGAGSVQARVFAPLPAVTSGAYEQAGGCGGFGKGNFAALFRSIEDYERTLKA
jgi:4-hydroxyphenylpyruvate dioxygenase